MGERRRSGGRTLSDFAGLDAEPCSDFQAQLSADLKLSADVGAVLVMDALHRLGVMPDAGAMLGEQFRLDLLGLDHLAL